MVVFGKKRSIFFRKLKVLVNLLLIMDTTVKDHLSCIFLFLKPKELMKMELVSKVFRRVISSLWKGLYKQMSSDFSIEVELDEVEIEIVRLLHKIACIIVEKRRHELNDVEISSAKDMVDYLNSEAPIPIYHRYVDEKMYISGAEIVTTVFPRSGETVKPTFVVEGDGEVYVKLSKLFNRVVPGVHNRAGKAWDKFKLADGVSLRDFIPINYRAPVVCRSLTMPYQVAVKKLMPNIITRPVNKERKIESIRAEIYNVCKRFKNSLQVTITDNLT